MIAVRAYGIPFIQKYLMVYKCSNRKEVLPMIAQRGIWASKMISKIKDAQGPKDIFDPSLRQQLLTLSIDHPKYYFDPKTRQQILNGFECVNFDRKFSLKFDSNLTNEKMDSLSKKETIFCPTNLVTTPMFKHLSNMNADIILISSIGINKDFPVKLMGYLSEIVHFFTYRYSKKQQNAILRNELFNEGLIDKEIPKLLYWKIDCEKLEEIDLGEMVLRQLPELFQEQIKELRLCTNIPDLRAKVTEKYTVNAGIPIKTVIEQIDKAVQFIKLWNNFFNQYRQKKNECFHQIEEQKRSIQYFSKFKQNGKDKYKYSMQEIRLSQNRIQTAQKQYQDNQKRYEQNKEANKTKYKDKAIILKDLIHQFKQFGSHCVFISSKEIDQSLINPIYYDNRQQHSQEEISLKIQQKYRKISTKYLQSSIKVEHSQGINDFWQYFFFQFTRRFDLFHQENNKIWKKQLFQKCKLIIFKSYWKHQAIDQFFNQYQSQQLSLLFKQIQKFTLKNQPPQRSANSRKRLIANILDLFNQFTKQVQKDKLQTFLFKNDHEFGPSINLQTKNLLLQILFRIAEKSQKYGFSALYFNIDTLKEKLSIDMPSFLLSKYHNKDLLDFTFDKQSKNIILTLSPSEYIQVSEHIFKEKIEEISNSLLQQMLKKSCQNFPTWRGNILQAQFCNIVEPGSILTIPKKVEKGFMNVKVEISQIVDFLPFNLNIIDNKNRSIENNFSMMLQKAQQLPGKYIIGMPFFTTSKGKEHSFYSRCFDFAIVSKNGSAFQIDTFDITTRKSQLGNKQKIFKKLISQLRVSPVNENNRKIFLNHHIICRKQKCRPPQTIVSNLPNTPFCLRNVGIFYCSLDNLYVQNRKNVIKQLFFSDLVQHSVSQCR